MKPFLILVAILVVLAALVDNVLFAHAAIQPTDGKCPVTWNYVDAPRVGNLHAVEAIAADDVWAAGDSDWLHWNGKTWTTVPNSVGAPLRGLAGLPDGEVWASNADIVMHWDGTQWTQVGDKIWRGILDIAVLAPDNIWATTINGVEHWDGNQWTYVPITELQSETYFLDITALAPDKIWVVGYAGHAKVAVGYAWDGKQWTLGPTTGAAESLFKSSSASAPDNVWVIGLYGYAIAQQFNGTDWIENDPPAYVLSDIKAFAPDDVYAVGDAIVHWDGKAWTTFMYPAGLVAISAVSATDLWAVGGATVLHGTSPCATPLTPTPTTEPPTPAPTATQEPCSVNPPQLLAPQNQAAAKKAPVSLTWHAQNCAKTYQVILRAGSTHGTKVVQKEVAKPRYKTATLTNGLNYYWHVRACNAGQCSRWSEWRSFTIEP